MQHRRDPIEDPAALLQALSQPRFWDESERLPGLFERYREADDSANAIACFGRIALHRFYETSSAAEYNPARRSIVSVFQPKSAGTFLHNRMLQLGYQDFWWFFPHRLNSYQCYASVEALKLFQIGGFTCHSHVQPDPNILAAFDRAGIEKIWIHLRNPAETAVSRYYHLLGEGHGAGEIAEERRQVAMAGGRKMGLTRNTSVSAHVVNDVNLFVNWVAAWLRFSQDRPGRIVFSFYSEMVDPQALLGRVFAEFGAALDGVVNAEPIAQDRYRAKRSKDWRSDLTPDAVQYVEQRVRIELERFPQFERLWS